jgi:hypothetical protein
MVFQSPPNSRKTLPLNWLGFYVTALSPHHVFAMTMDICTKIQSSFIRAHLLRMLCEWALGDNLPGPDIHPSGSVSPHAGILQPLRERGCHLTKIYGQNRPSWSIRPSVSTLEHCHYVSKHMLRLGYGPPWSGGLCCGVLG